MATILQIPHSASRCLSLIPYLGVCPRPDQVSTADPVAPFPRGTLYIRSATLAPLSPLYWHASRWDVVPQSYLWAIWILPQKNVWQKTLVNMISWHLGIKISIERDIFMALSSIMQCLETTLRFRKKPLKTETKLLIRQDLSTLIRHTHQGTNSTIFLPGAFFKCFGVNRHLKSLWGQQGLFYLLALTII